MTGRREGTEKEGKEEGGQGGERGTLAGEGEPRPGDRRREGEEGSEDGRPRRGYNAAPRADSQRDGECWSRLPLTSVAPGRA